MMITLIVQLAEILEEAGQHVGLLTSRFEGVRPDGNGHRAILLRDAQRSQIARRHVANLAEQLIQTLETLQSPVHLICIPAPESG